MAGHQVELLLRDRREVLDCAAKCGNAFRQPPPLRLVLRQRQHLGGGIAEEDAVPCLCHQHGEVTGAATRVKDSQAAPGQREHFRLEVPPEHLQAHAPFARAVDVLLELVRDRIEVCVPAPHANHYREVSSRVESRNMES